MNSRSFPVQDSTLSADALAQQIRDHYPLPSAVMCRFHRKGICDTYQVFAGEKILYLKVYRHERRSFTDVSEEARLLMHLASDGIAVAVPVTRTDGQHVNQLLAPEGERYALLFHAAPGAPGDEGDLDRIRELGHMVARMHQSGDSLSPSYARSHLDLRHLVDDNLELIATFMSHRLSDLNLIQSIADECKKLPLFTSIHKPKYGVCHGDLHGGDVAYSDHNVPTLFDFDSSGIGWRALDIGVFPASVDWMDTSEKTESLRKRRLEVFLDGYSRIRNLTDDEAVATNFTAPIRHIYLMGHVLRYTTVTEGNHWANDQFIDWHMSWFRHWLDAEAPL